MQNENIYKKIEKITTAVANFFVELDGDRLRDCVNQYGSEFLGHYDDDGIGSNSIVDHVMITVNSMIKNSEIDATDVLNVLMAHRNEPKFQEFEIYDSMFDIFNNNLTVLVCERILNHYRYSVARA